MAVRHASIRGDFVQGSFGLLPLAGDRARAALHFSRIVGQKSSDTNVELARWYLRAALSEFRSIFDLLNADLRKMRLLSRWEQSPQVYALQADSTVSVLRKVRDFAIHSASIVGEPKTFQVTSIENRRTFKSELKALVFEPLDRNALSAGRGKDDLSAFEDSTLAEFNQQAASWPADMLIHIAVYRTSEPLAAFLALNRDVG